MVPFISGFIEARFPMPTTRFETSASVIVNAGVTKAWENIIRVKRITPDEYEPGFFNRAGIPRPMYAELSYDSLGALRTGHFEGGLVFTERVMAWEKNHFIAFDIHIVPSTSGNSVFEKHILSGEHFNFLGASYKLDSLGPNQTRITLGSSYRLSSNLNAYGSFWGNLILGDFQERLLGVIKLRCESGQP